MIVFCCRVSGISGCIVHRTGGRGLLLCHRLFPLTGLEAGSTEEEAFRGYGGCDVITFIPPKVDFLNLGGFAFTLGLSLFATSRPVSHGLRCHLCAAFRTAWEQLSLQFKVLTTTLAAPASCII